MRKGLAAGLGLALCDRGSLGFRPVMCSAPTRWSPSRRASCSAVLPGEIGNHRESARSKPPGTRPVPEDPSPLRRAEAMQPQSHLGLPAVGERILAVVVDQDVERAAMSCDTIHFAGYPAWGRPVVGGLDAQDVGEVLLRPWNRLRLGRSKQHVAGVSARPPGAKYQFRPRRQCRRPRLPECGAKACAPPSHHRNPDRGCGRPQGSSTRSSMSSASRLCRRSIPSAFPVRTHSSKVSLTASDERTRVSVDESGVIRLVVPVAIGKCRQRMSVSLTL